MTQNTSYQKVNPYTKILKLAENANFNARALVKNLIIDFFQKPIDIRIK